MNIPSVSAIEKRAQDFDTLRASLQNGNVVAAQGAFAAFLQDVHNVTTAAGPNGLFAPGSAATKDLSTLGEALKSSNLSAARAAFAELQTDLHAAGNSHPVASNQIHRALSRADIAANSAVPLQSISSGALSRTIGTVLNQKA